MKLYIETSVPNMLLHDDAPEKMRITRLFVEWLMISNHERIISTVLVREISRARSPRRQLLEQEVVKLKATMVDISDEVNALANHYLTARIVASRFPDDLLHVAVAVCYRVDMIVSWNMKHLANPTKVALVKEMNRQQGYPFMRIHTPQEVLGL